MRGTKGICGPAAFCVVSVALNLLADHYLPAEPWHTMIAIACSVVMFIYLRPLLNRIFKLDA